MNSPTELVLLATKNGMVYLTNNPHEPIMYLRKKIHKTHEIPHQCFFKAMGAQTKKTRNTPTSSINIVIQIMPEIYLTDTQSHQKFIS